MIQHGFIRILCILALLLSPACSKSSGGGGSQPPPTTTEDQDLALIAKTKAGLVPEAILGANSAATAVVWNLKLPTQINGVSIAWTSDRLDVIANDGTVTRPSLDDATVTLTATLKAGQKTDTVRIVVTVLRDVSGLLDEAAGNLAVKNLLGTNPSAAAITGNLDLPATLGSVAITWTSSDPATVSANGTVARPAYPATAKPIVLTATLRLAKETRTKTFDITVLALPQSDEQKVAEVAATITRLSLLGRNQSPDAITTDLNLKVDNALGVKVIWESSEPAWLSPEGVVQRPEYDQTPIAITLTAKLELNAARDALAFSYTIEPKPINDEQAIAKAKASLTIDTLLNQNLAFSAIKTSLTLPQGLLANDVAVTWSSSDAQTISPSGRVNRPAYRSGNKDVILSAHFSRRDPAVKDSAPFKFTVIQADPNDQDLVDDAKRDLVQETLLLANTSLTHVTSRLNLIDHLGLVAIRWTSSHAAIDASGHVAQPSYQEGDAQVILTAALSYGQGRAEQIFKVTVPKKLPTPAETLADFLLTFNESRFLGNNTSVADVRSPLQLATDFAWADGMVRVAWTSTADAINTNSGAVKRPDFDSEKITVGLTATFTYGASAPVSRTYNLTLTPEEGTAEQWLARAMREVSEATVLARNPSVQQVTSDLYLPQISVDKKVTITWSSTAPQTIATTGAVTRPPYRDGSDATVTVSARFQVIGTTLEPGILRFTVTVPKQPASAQEQVDDALKLITIESLLNGNASQARVTGDLSLPASYQGISAVWSSTDRAISPSGAVTRPEFEANNADVRLTVRLTLGQATGSAMFDLTVLKKEPTAQQTVDAYATAFDARTLLGLNKDPVDSSGKAKIRFDLDLPSANPAGDIRITWVSSDPAVIASTGSVTRPEFGQPADDVTLTGTFAYQGKTRVRTFAFTVLAKEATAEQLLAVASAELTIESLLKANPLASSITSDLRLPQQSRDQQVAITWTTSNDRVILVSGKVTRPAYRVGDVNVTLKATLTISGAVPVEKSFDFTVKKAAPSEHERLEDAFETITLESLLNGNKSAAEIKTDLKLPAAVDGFQLVWSADPATAIRNSGAVFQPQWGQKNVDVKLTVKAALDSALVRTFDLTVVAKDPTPQQLVDRAVAGISVSKLLGQNPNNVEITRDLSLPDQVDGLPILWKSNKAEIISPAGAVTRPAFRVGETKVSLTAQLSYSGATASKSFEFVVLPVPPTEEEIYAVGYESLQGDLIQSANVNLLEVISDLRLPVELHGVAIAWTSSNPAVIAPSGAVTRLSFGPGDSDVTLTAHLSYGQTKGDKVFQVRVLELPGSDQETFDRAVRDLNFEAIKKANPDDQHVATALNLVSKFKKATVTWVSEVPATIANSGAVVRPKRGTSPVPVTLTATIKYKNFTDTKKIKVVVTPAMPKSLLTYDLKSPTNAQPQRVPLGRSLLLNGVIVYDDGSRQGGLAQEMQWKSTGVLNLRMGSSSGIPMLVVEASRVGTGSVIMSHPLLPNQSVQFDVVVDEAAFIEMRFMADHTAGEGLVLHLGEILPLKVEVNYTDNESRFIDVSARTTFESSIPDAVAIDENLVLTAVKPGKVNFTARYKDAEGREISQTKILDILPNLVRTPDEAKEIQRLREAILKGKPSGFVQEGSLVTVGNKQQYETETRFVLSPGDSDDPCRFSLNVTEVRAFLIHPIDEDSRTYDLDLGKLAEATVNISGFFGNRITIAGNYGGLIIPVKIKSSASDKDGRVISSVETSNFVSSTILQYGSFERADWVPDFNSLVQECRKGVYLAP